MAISMAAAMLGGSLISSAFGLFGANKQNKAARAEAATNREFQERLSSTAYQRAAKDMEKAGLNRILAAKQGGASTPGGNMAPVVNEMAQAASNTQAAAMNLANINNTEANSARTIQENIKFKKFGSGPWADKADNIEKMLNTGKKAINTKGNTIKRKSLIQRRKDRGWENPTPKTAPFERNVHKQTQKNRRKGNIWGLKF